MRKVLLLAFVVATLSSCTKDDEGIDLNYINGSYKAIEAEFGYGWKGYLNLAITDDKITSVEYDYLNVDGNKKSGTTEAEYPMDPHPSVWLPQYESSLMSADILEFSDIDAISGATHSGETVNKMMKVLLEAAKTGNTSEQIITD